MRECLACPCPVPTSRPRFASNPAIVHIFANSRVDMRLPYLSLFLLFFSFPLSSFRSFFGRHSPKWNIIRYPYRNRRPCAQISFWCTADRWPPFLRILKTNTAFLFCHSMHRVYRSSVGTITRNIIIIHITTQHNIFIWSTYISKMYRRTATMEFLH